MYNNQYQNQTLETAQLTNPNQNTMNLNPPPPKMGQPYYPNPQPPQMGQPYNSNPQFPPASQPLTQGTPNVPTAPVNNAITNAANSGSINIAGPTINVGLPTPVIEKKITRARTILPSFDRESLTIICPVCEGSVQTITKKKTNMKALLTAIGTCYCGYACYQCFNGKEVTCECDDYEHYCPVCNYKFGVYYAM